MLIALEPQGILSQITYMFTKLFDFSYSSMQLYVYVLLSPNLCFISFLYLDLYVLGDDQSIS